MLFRYFADRLSARLVWIAFALLFASACEDATRPEAYAGSRITDRHEAARSFDGEGDPLPVLSGTLSPQTSSVSLGPDTIGSYPEETLVDVTVEGLLERFNSNWSGHYANKGIPLGQWDALGLFSQSLGGCSGNVDVRGSLLGAISFCDIYNQLPLQGQTTVTKALRGSIVLRWQRGPPLNPGCDGAQPPAEPCYTFNGSHTVTVTPVEANLALSVTPGTSVVESTQLTFTGSVSPTTHNNVPVPKRVVEWRWVPDSPDGRTIENCHVTYWTCTFRVYSSGRMYLDAVASGVLKTEEIHIEVAPAKPTLTAVPSFIAAGDSVLFTATVAPVPPQGWTITGWVWMPDSGSGGLSAGCPTNQPTCKRKVTKSGTMKVRVLIAGRADSTTARVKVTPCLTDDPVLDNESVRSQLMNELFKSNVDSTPDKRLEQAGYIYKTPDGSLVVFPATNFSTACMVLTKPKSQLVGLPTGSILVGTYHTHPLSEGDPQTGCPTGEVDLNLNPIYPTEPWPPETFGHGGDWSWTNINEVPEYVITKDGWIYRLDWPVPADIAGGTPHRWLWNNGPGNACTWTQ